MDRIHAALDGDLPRDDLTAEERAALAGFEARMGELRGVLAARMPHDLDARVMRRLHDQGLEPLPAPQRWSPLLRTLVSLWAPRDVRLRYRPAYVLAVAAALALLFLAPLRPGSPGVDVAPGGGRLADAGAPTAARSGRIYVQFRLRADGAENVALAGSFTDWQPAYPMQQTADGLWTVMLPITPGVHDYAFVVDGERWVPDPYAPQVDDGFGGVNSRLTLLTPEMP